MFRLVVGFIFLPFMSSWAKAVETSGNSFAWAGMPTDYLIRPVSLFFFFYLLIICLEAQNTRGLISSFSFFVDDP